jgi:hypothetical protein
MKWLVTCFVLKAFQESVLVAFYEVAKPSSPTNYPGNHAAMVSSATKKTGAEKCRPGT